jgi:hypothetical protein
MSTESCRWLMVMTCRESGEKCGIPMRSALMEMMVEVMVSRRIWPVGWCMAGSMHETTMKPSEMGYFWLFFWFVS